MGKMVVARRNLAVFYKYPIVWTMRFLPQLLLSSLAEELAKATSLKNHSLWAKSNLLHTFVSEV